MLQETETEEILGFFCHIFVISDILIGGGSRPAGAPAPLVAPMCWVILFWK